MILRDYVQQQTGAVLHQESQAYLSTVAQAILTHDSPVDAQAAVAAAREAMRARVKAGLAQMRARLRRV